MTDKVMMMIGDYQFSIDNAAYQEFQRTTAYSWASQERIGRAPSLQFTGKGEDVIELNGVIFPHYRGGLGQLNDMRGMAEKGEPMTLIAAPSLTGEVLGEWCILSVTEGQTIFAPGGIPKMIEFGLTLSFYGEDE